MIDNWLSIEKEAVLSCCTYRYCTNAGVQTDKQTLAWKTVILVQGGSATLFFRSIYVRMY